MQVGCEQILAHTDPIQGLAALVGELLLSDGFFNVKCCSPEAPVCRVVSLCALCIVGAGTAPVFPWDVLYCMSFGHGSPLHC